MEWLNYKIPYPSIKYISIELSKFKSNSLKKKSMLTFLIEFSFFLILFSRYILHFIFFELIFKVCKSNTSGLI